jgi:flavin reductase (DIM6/NTAB) family NADH-FMN oxidoreductase RutF
MLITRRKLSVAIPAVIGVGALAACAGKTAAQVTQEAVNDAEAIANGLSNFLQSAVGIPPNVVTTVTTYAKDAKTAADGLVAGMTQSAGQSIVNQISTDVSKTANAVQGLVQAGSVAANILSDIQLAMPILLTLLGLLGVGAAENSGAAMDRLKALPKVALHG